MGISYLIQNLPPEENSRLRSIHVLAYVYKQDLSDSDDNMDYGPDIVLRAFFQELELLESEDGVIIMVKGEPYVLRATLITCAGDVLAAHELLRLAAPSSARFCLHCTVTRKGLHQNIFAMGEDRSKDVHLNHVEAVKTMG